MERVDRAEKGFEKEDVSRRAFQGPLAVQGLFEWGAPGRGSATTLVTAAVYAYLGLASLILARAGLGAGQIVAVGALVWPLGYLLGIEARRRLHPDHARRRR